MILMWIDKLQLRYRSDEVVKWRFKHCKSIIHFEEKLTKWGVKLGADSLELGIEVRQELKEVVEPEMVRRKLDMEE